VEAQTAKRNTDTALADVQQEYADMKRKYGASNDLIASLKQQVAALEQTRDHAMGEIQGLQGQLGELQKLYAPCPNMIAGLQGEVAGRDDKIKLQHTEIEGLHLKVKDLKGHLGRLDKKLAAELEKEEALARSLAEERKKETALEASLAKEREDLAATKAALERDEAALRDNTEVFANKDAEIAELKRHLVKIKLDLGDLMKAHEPCEGIIDSLRRELQDMEKAKDGQIKELMTHLSRVVSESDDLHVD
jgi:chromosome segregation ATPase